CSSDTVGAVEVARRTLSSLANGAPGAHLHLPLFHHYPLIRCYIRLFDAAASVGKNYFDIARLCVPQPQMRNSLLPAGVAISSRNFFNSQKPLRLSEFPRRVYTDERPHAHAIHPIAPTNRDGQPVSGRSFIP